MECGDLFQQLPTLGNFLDATVLEEDLLDILVIFKNPVDAVQLKQEILVMYFLYG